MTGERLVDQTQVLDPRRTRIRWDQHDGVKVRLPDGAEHFQVRLEQAFPVTRRRRFILLYDREGNEIGILPELKGLDPKSQETAQRELDRSYFLTRIKRIERVEERYGLATWHVITNRGPRTFNVRSRSENMASARCCSTSWARAWRCAVTSCSKSR